MAVQNRTLPQVEPTEPNPAQVALVSARRAAGLTLRELAGRAGTSHTTLSAYETGSKVPKIDTFLKILNACDHAIDFELHPRIRSSNGMSRGEELAQALELAEQFPANPAKTLKFPILAKLPRPNDHTR